MTHKELTESQKHEWIDEQIRKGGSVFCPWCSAINVAGNEETPCCTPFAFAIKDRSDSLMRQFSAQYAAIEIGVASSITCPYCREVNRAPGPRDPADWKRPMVNPFCCDLFCMALAAHLEVKRVQNLVRRADEIAEKYDKAARN